MSTDDMGDFQLESGTVPLHFHSSCEALADVDYVYATMGGLVKQSHDPWCLGRIARTISSHHDATKIWRFEDVAYDIVLYARE